MMKKVLGILAAMVLLTLGTCALAEQMPSPTLRTRIDSETVVFESGAVAEDFAIWLDAEVESIAVLLTKMQEFVETNALVNFFDEDVQVTAAEYLPQDFDMEALMLAEVYALRVDNYVSAYGDVDASFEFALNYEDDTVLLGMIGIANEEWTENLAEEWNAEDLPELSWTPILANAHEGRVVLTMNQELLEQISQSEYVFFVLLQQ